MRPDCRYGHGAAWAAIVAGLMQAAAAQSVRAEVVTVLSREVGTIRDPDVASAVAAALEHDASAPR